MHQIRQLAQVIARAMGLRSQDEAQAAQDALSEGSEGLLGLNLATLKALPLPVLRDLLDGGGADGDPRLALAASLLAEAAAWDPSQGPRARALLAGIHSVDLELLALVARTRAVWDAERDGGRRS